MLAKCETGSWPIKGDNGGGVDKGPSWVCPGAIEASVGRSGSVALLGVGCRGEGELIEAAKCEV